MEQEALAGEVGNLQAVGKAVAAQPRTAAGRDGGQDRHQPLVHAVVGTDLTHVVHRGLAAGPDHGGEELFLGSVGLGRDPLGTALEVGRDPADPTRTVDQPDPPGVEEGMEGIPGVENDREALDGYLVRAVEFPAIRSWQCV